MILEALTVCCYCKMSLIRKRFPVLWDIITINVYGDNKVMAVDCTREIDMFIEELHLHQMELTMAEERTFDTVCVKSEDLS